MSCIYTEDPELPVIELRVLGRVTQHDMDEILPKIEAFIARHGKVRIVEVIEKFEGSTRRPCSTGSSSTSII